MVYNPLMGTIFKNIFNVHHVYCKLKKITSVFQNYGTYCQVHPGSQDLLLRIYIGMLGKYTCIREDASWGYS